MNHHAHCLQEDFGVDENLPILDTAQIEMLREMGDDLVTEILESFTEEVEPRLNTLEQRCAQRDEKQLKDDIHFVAGSAANLGLLRLAELCRNIEEQIKNQTLNTWDKIPQTVRDEYTTALEAFRA